MSGYCIRVTSIPAAIRPIARGSLSKRLYLRPNISYSSNLSNAMTLTFDKLDEYDIFIQLVKRHDTDVLFQFDLLFYTSFDKTDRCKIVGCKNRRWKHSRLDHAFSDPIRRFYGIIAHKNKAGVDLKAAVLQCFYIASVALPYHFVFSVARNDADLPMARRYHCFHSMIRTVKIIKEDTVPQIQINRCIQKHRGR